MFPILFLLFTLLPVLELVILFKIGAVFGGWNTIAMVILGGFVGAYLAKREGRLILIKIQSQMNQGSLPSNELIHGLLVFGGGLLLLTPGFVSDLFGLLMLLPGTRHLLVIAIKHHFKNALAKGKMHVFQSGFGSGFGGKGGFYYKTQNSNWRSNQSEMTTEREVIDVSSVSLDENRK